MTLSGQLDAVLALADAVNDGSHPSPREVVLVPRCGTRSNGGKFTHNARCGPHEGFGLSAEEALSSLLLRLEDSARAQAVECRRAADKLDALIHEFGPTGGAR